MRIILFLLLTWGDFAVAQEHIIKEIAPLGIEHLASEVTKHSAKAKKGSHGSIEYCYDVESYVIYSSNLLGHGYELSQEAPEDITCTKPEFSVISKNKLGMYVGMSKHEVESLIGVHNLPESKTIIWLSKVVFDGITYDHQTHIQFKFKKGVLVWLSVFTTETS
jgi:hypothetical protein